MFFKKIKIALFFALIAIGGISCDDSKPEKYPEEKPTTLIEKSADFERDTVRKDAMQVEKDLRKLEQEN